MEWLSGAKKNIVKAITLFQQGANLGHPEALLHLARAYREGLGVEKDDVKATALFHRIINLPNCSIFLYGNALGELTRAYMEGLRVPEDNAKMKQHLNATLSNLNRLESIYHGRD